MCAQSNRQFKIFLDPAEIQSLDSMEGVPYYDPASVEPLPGERFLTTNWQKCLHRGFDWVGTMAPGVVLAMLMAIAGGYMATLIGQSLMGFERSPLSPILVAVILGLLVRNISGLPKAYEAGLRLCLRLILRVGVAGSTVTGCLALSSPFRRDGLHQSTIKRKL